jgi:hypothetical protein
VRTKPRLRFDKVALRFVADLRTALHDAVPKGKTLALTITAPIRQDSKTAAEVERQLRELLSRRSSKLTFDETIHANRIRAHLIDGNSPRIPNVIGFVHNPDTDAAELLRAAQALLAGKPMDDDLYTQAVKGGLVR